MLISFMASYLVDWEWWRESTDKDVWRDTQYILWNLAYDPHGDCDDMSTWEL